MICRDADGGRNIEIGMRWDQAALALGIVLPAVIETGDPVRRARTRNSAACRDAGNDPPTRAPFPSVSRHMQSSMIEQPRAGGAAGFEAIGQRHRIPARAECHGRLRGIPALTRNRSSHAGNDQAPGSRSDPSCRRARRRRRDSSSPDNGNFDAFRCDRSYPRAQRQPFGAMTDKFEKAVGSKSSVKNERGGLVH